jgi:hypothetical protein
MAAPPRGRGNPGGAPQDQAQVPLGLASERGIVAGLA